MRATLFLTIPEVLELHASRIEKYGGSHGVCDLALLESALAQPKQSFGGEFLHADLASMAAAYLFHIVQNHPFIDGNKRTGAAAAIVFLKVNGARLRANETGLGDLVLAVASGQASKEDVAAFFRSHIGEQ